MLGFNKHIYVSASHLYHYARNFYMKCCLMFKAADYLKPRVPRDMYKSQYGQDFYMEKYGLIKAGDFFVEIGANHPIYNSNSYYLEKVIGCDGVSIDALDYLKDYEKVRSAKFINALISNETGKRHFHAVKSENGWEDQLSSIHHAEIDQGKIFNSSVKSLPTIPLRDIAAINRQIDILMIDVEGHEFEVLESLNWIVHAPKIILIENNGEFFPRRKLEQYMKQRGYFLKARIGSTDDIYLVLDRQYVSEVDIAVD
jgi:FkbM family methyltransferase